VPGYTPPEFTDEGRDAFLKVLHGAVRAAHGDPDRLWLTGFSWAALASYDTALHRPGVLRGIVPLGGGPRRVHYRLFPNVAPTVIHSFCGGKDDPELVWNLKEVARIAPKLKLEARVTIDPANGHSLPLLGQETGTAAVSETPPLDAPVLPSEGVLLADGPNVATPLMVVLEVDPKRVAVPQRVPVSASLDADGQRRATIKAMDGKVARLEWKLARVGEAVRLDLAPDGVKKIQVRLRPPWVERGQDCTVRLKGKTVFAGKVEPDARAILMSARAEGNRTRPVLLQVTAGP
jgi:hypothetical protein